MFVDCLPKLIFLLLIHLHLSPRRRVSVFARSVFIYVILNSYKNVKFR